MKNRNSLCSAVSLLTVLSPLAVSFCSVSAFAAPHGMYLTKQLRELRGFSSSTRSGVPMLYYGGPVISHAKVYTVFWGNDVESTTQKQIGGFFSATVNSTYMDWMKLYNTVGLKAVDGRAGTEQSIGRGTYGGEIMIKPFHTGKRLDDKDIQTELDQQIDANILPKPDADTLFMIYFPPGISITIEGQTSCQAFCAYHEGFVSKKSGSIFYGVMPDLGGACSFGCGSQGNRFDDLTVTSSHELAEAITDPFPTPGDKPAYPQAWNTSKGEEIGDLCTTVSTRLSTQGLTYILQQEYDKSTLACAPGPYQNP